jgi:hypothetical protein
VDVDAAAWINAGLHDRPGRAGAHGTQQENDGTQQKEQGMAGHDRQGKMVRVKLESELRGF